MEILDKLRKLKALADKGSPGEKENAQSLLNRLMAKYKIKEEQLANRNTARYEFRVKEDDYFLFLHVALPIVEEPNIRYTKRSIDKHTPYFITATHEEAVEVKAKFDFYKEEFDKEYELFKKAFIHRNKLYAKKDKEVIRDLSKEELEELARILDLMKGIKGSQYFKQLEE